MRLKGKAKEVWWNFRQIKDSKEIPLELDMVFAVDSNEDDDYLFYIIEYVKNIKEIYFKDTCITDDALKYICQTTGLKKLTLAKHQTITNLSLPYLSNLLDLEYLDITHTKINLLEIEIFSKLTKLKEMHLSASEEDEILFQKINDLKKQLPNCLFFINNNPIVTLGGADIK
jgi:hypothetical protein